MRRPLVIGLAVGFMFGAATGWGFHALTDDSSTLSLAAPVSPDPRCPALLAALPAALGPSLPARATNPTSPSTRAWGSPAITVVCGGQRPSRIIDSNGLSIDGVEWSSPHEGANPTIYRNKDLTVPYLVVTLPRSVTPVTILGPLVDALKTQRLSATLTSRSTNAG